jgi:hypothetical protein
MLQISSLAKSDTVCLLPTPGKYRNPEKPGEYAEYYNSVPWSEKIKEDSERVEAHLMKIREADVIYLVNPGGYVGSHTVGEIYAAHERGKPIYALERICSSSPPTINTWVEVLSPDNFFSLFAQALLA